MKDSLSEHERNVRNESALANGIVDPGRKDPTESDRVQRKQDYKGMWNVIETNTKPKAKST
jgi:hypothetical protein